MRPVGVGIFLSGLLTACGWLPSLPTFPPNSTPFGIPVATLPGFEPGGFSLPPVWQVPDVPEDALKPIPGAPPQWWHWVPIHAAPLGAAEYDSAFHYTLDAAPSEVQEYYREALPQAGWEPRMDEFVTGDYSMFTCSRYGEAVIIYVSPYDAGTIVSILLD